MVEAGQDWSASPVHLPIGRCGAPALRMCPPWAGRGAGRRSRGLRMSVDVRLSALARPDARNDGKAREPPGRAANVDEVRVAGVSRAGGSRAKPRELRPLLGGVTAASGSRRRSASGRRRLSRQLRRRWRSVGGVVGCMVGRPFRWFE